MLCIATNYGCFFTLTGYGGMQDHSPYCLLDTPPIDHGRGRRQGKTEGQRGSHGVRVKVRDIGHCLGAGGEIN
jgi:hypothetical protein